MTAAPTVSRLLTVRELLEHEVLAAASLVAGRAGLDRFIGRLNVMTVPSIERWVEADEFLLTTGFPLPAHGEMEQLVRDLDALGLAGLGVKLDSYLPELAPNVLQVAEELAFPLVVIPEEVRFDDILSQVFGTIINRQAAELAQAQEIHRAFLGVTLEGGGIDTLASDLSGVLRGAPVVISDRSGKLLASSGDLTALRALGLLLPDGMVDVSKATVGLHRDRVSDVAWAVGAVRAGTLHHGFVIAAEGASRFGDVALIAVDQASIVAALEVTRDLAVGAVERQFASNVLHEVLSSRGTGMEEAAARGAGFGWDLDRQVTVLVCRAEAQSSGPHLSKKQARLAEQRATEFWTSAVRTRGQRAAAASLGTELVAVLDTGGDPKAAARSFQAELTSFTRRDYSIGVSRVHQGPDGIKAAYEEARAALRLGPKVTGRASVTAYDELGLFRLLAQVDERELMTFVDDTLGSVLRLPETERVDLMQTLEALLEHNLNIAETSRNVHYHYNTLRYRLAKLERLLGPFSTDAGTARRVGVALEIRKMQVATR